MSHFHALHLPCRQKMNDVSPPDTYHLSGAFSRHIGSETVNIRSATRVSQLGPATLGWFQSSLRHKEAVRNDTPGQRPKHYL